MMMMYILIPINKKRKDLLTYFKNFAKKEIS